MTDLEIIKEIEKELGVTLEERGNLEEIFNIYPGQPGYLKGEEQKIIGLSLIGLKREKLPPLVWELRHLEFLNLSKNKLSSLPPEIGQLQALQTFYVYQNQLSSLPSEITSINSKWVWQDKYSHDTINFYNNPLVSPR